MRIPLKYNLRNLRVRAARTALTVAGVALVIMIFITVRAMVQGLKGALVQTGSPDNVVLLEPGPVATMEFGELDRDVLNVVRSLPYVARKGEEPLVSPEAYASTWVTRPGSQEDVWMNVRGVQSIAFDVHDGVRGVQGQGPRPAGGIIVGKLVRTRLGQVKPGDTLRFGTREWTVVWLFAAGGSVYESEIWADLDDLLVDLRRERLSAVTLKVADPVQVAEVIFELNTQSQVVVEAQPEVTYYATLARQFEQLEMLGVLSAMVMAAAAIFGGMNTMFTAVAGRLREIGTLKALGFSRHSVLAAFLFESVVIALAEGILGTLLGAASHGLATSAPTVAFTFTVTGRIVAEGLGLSLLIGLLGGWWPARLAARLPVIEAMRHM